MREMASVTDAFHCPIWRPATSELTWPGVGGVAVTASSTSSGSPSVDMTVSQALPSRIPTTTRGHDKHAAPGTRIEGERRENDGAGPWPHDGIVDRRLGTGRAHQRLARLNRSAPSTSKRAASPHPMMPSPSRTQDTASWLGNSASRSSTAGIGIVRTCNLPGRGSRRRHARWTSGRDSRSQGYALAGVGHPESVSPRRVRAGARRRFGA